MSPTLMARVDGLPVQLLDRQRVWPAADRAAQCRRELSAGERARVERQTAVVHDCGMPVWARQLMAEEVAEFEWQEIRGAMRSDEAGADVMKRPRPGGRAVEPRELATVGQAHRPTPKDRLEDDRERAPHARTRMIRLPKKRRRSVRSPARTPGALSSDAGALPRRTLRGDAELYRIHHRERGPWWFSSDGAGRFDPTGTGLGACYLADRSLGAWVEVFRRETQLSKRAAGDRVARSLAAELSKALIR